MMYIGVNRYIRLGLGFRFRIYGTYRERGRVENQKEWEWKLEWKLFLGASWVDSEIPAWYLIMIRRDPQDYR